MSDVNKLGVLGLALLGLLITMGIIFIVGGQFQKTICEDIDESTYTGGNCDYQSRAFNNTGTVLTAIELLLAFTTIVVLVSIAKMIMDIAKGMKS